MISPGELCKVLSTVVLGKEEQVALLVSGFLADGHVLIEDVPGVGKTTLAIAFSRALGLPMARIQMTADLLPGDLLGSNIYDPQQGRFVFHPGPIFHSVVLIDEINRASPRTQSALLEAMAEHQISNEGDTLQLPPLFFVLATQNPAEHSGVFPLPESQMDRFILRFSLGYLGHDEERKLLRGAAKRPESIRQQGTEDLWIHWRHMVRSIYFGEEVENMLLQLVQASRVDNRVRLGISTRGALSLQRVAQSWAFLQGRKFVIPEDLVVVTPSVCSHRIFSKELGESGEDLVRSLMQEQWGV